MIFLNFQSVYIENGNGDEILENMDEWFGDNMEH